MEELMKTYLEKDAARNGAYRAWLKAEDEVDRALSNLAWALINATEWAPVLDGSKAVVSEAVSEEWGMPANLEIAHPVVKCLFIELDENDTMHLYEPGSTGGDPIAGLRYNKGRWTLTRFQ